MRSHTGSQQLGRLELKHRSLANGAGLEIIDPFFRPSGLLALKLVFKIPPRVREPLFFGSSRFCLLLQKLIVRALGGVFTVRGRFTDGPMKGQNFTCLTSEAYFILGSHRELDLQRVVAATVRAGDTIYDIGAHVGYTALLFAALAGSSGQVLAFEPSPLNCARLRENIGANPKVNVRIINTAISDREGVAVLRECGTMSGLVSGTATPAGTTSSVQTIRLDDFVYRDSNPPPTVVKLDVEGHGGLVLAGMADVLRSQRPRMICELHDPREDEQATKILVACDYELSAIGGWKFPKRILATPRF